MYTQRTLLLPCVRKAAKPAKIRGLAQGHTVWMVRGHLALGAPPFPEAVTTPILKFSQGC